MGELNESGLNDRENLACYFITVLCTTATWVETLIIFDI